ncbi:hypothetical protein CYPRO_1721 [Cyclonatronum proteinivorum]|uniref:DUF6398 domain-containing protein n=1 Tax=Cyclonatronum proteinivorum TaxID=1457365 RepID=A0A345UKH0_9BACT|nr:DUF6398 domain-containing protein [Cyclonatronum proteinivorum]AXJ00972.1 hypothetical protein CYPRO_1721 [Cyclonatronum proteinivorum]
MTKEEIKRIEQQLCDMTAEFCHEHINEEYAHLCDKLIKKLGRKRDVPFQRGKPEIWAACVVYTIGSINFLFDKSFEPYIPPGIIHEHFGTKNTTVTTKASQIRKMLKLKHFDPEFSTGHMEDSNPLNDIVMIDGMLVPISSLPEDIQELVRYERSKGGK